ncbi:uncharacterized protein Z520_02405 [Fonsecaea multimorphosa CBS 102226]|uniref:Metallo-beta-lactamase domain-containing protein n=1 Tax=Fonsecaea multimorphosa CBS 102226 TaxID=1442371 RepID=A0A0D2IYZ9_9EURO|nr:uncharacterized protein Z520_02405 [Fonsecaea multimorphosa CBS 102226]KIY02267.1 hypothetical protein Z520_02405 [Fonsecaea multimorphosa CBS 102226]OAL28915.1 hypothetical protein AYO22_02351 [Fonsecaea multimorphosa]
MIVSQNDLLVAPKAVPPLDIPPSTNTVTVRIIDSTSQLTAHMSMIVEPHIPGHDLLRCPAYSFLVEHPSGRKLLYDLGTRKDWQNFSPVVNQLLKDHDLTVEVKKDVAEILEDHGVPAGEGAIEAIIWSHWHYDHIGDPSTFPASTKLIVGPGFKKAFLPGYPAGPDSVILESDYKGRDLVELEFSSSQKRIGGLQYIDYFGDGSFYVLDAPGHALGHVSALARVTCGHGDEDDTFIFMGGDACHHGGEFRPTEYLPLPRAIVPSPFPRHTHGVCPGAWLQALHHEQRADRPFYRLKPGFAHDQEAVEETIHKLEAFDAADNVFVIIAHDPSLLDEGFPMFPAVANDWARHNFAEKVRWCFVKDFEAALKEVQEN